MARVEVEEVERELARMVERGEVEVEVGEDGVKGYRRGTLPARPEADAEKHAQRPGLIEKVTWATLGRLALLGLLVAAVWLLLAVIVRVLLGVAGLIVVT